MRISLGGGGTDLPQYWRKYGGLAVGFSLDRYVHVVAGGLSTDVAHANMETSAEQLHRELVNAALRYSGWPNQTPVSYQSDVRPGSGLGGSGAFLVALASILLGSGTSKAAAAQLATSVEVDTLGRATGYMDPYLAAFGGVNVLHISASGAVAVEMVGVSRQLETYLTQNLLLVEVGGNRDASTVLRSQADSLAESRTATTALMQGIHQIGQAMADVVREGRAQDVGPLLAEHWRLKRRLSDRVTSPEIDRTYHAALDAGADGGKLIGAGGGGYLLVSSPSPSQTVQIRDAMAGIGAGVTAVGLDTVGVSLNSSANVMQQTKGTHGYDRPQT
jgi:D-glycero-alpha-D-manno-heptose-7-phosphate kinase